MADDSMTVLKKAERSGLRDFRLYWLAIALILFYTWPYVDLSIWHLVFSVGLCFSLYFGYSRSVLPLAIYFTVMLLYWVIVPMFQQKIGVGYYSSYEAIPQFSPAALAFVMTHLVGILAGVQLGRIPKKNYSDNRLGLSVIGIFLVLMTLLLLINFVGFEILFSRRVDQGTASFSNYITFLRNFIKVLPAIVLTYFILEDDKNEGRGIRFAALIAIATIFLTVSNPVNTSRFLSIFGLLVVMLTYAIKSSRRKILGFMLATSPIHAIFLLSVTSVMRFGFDRIHSTNIFHSLQTLEFSSYSIFIDALKVEHLPHANYFISHLFIIIPRGIWPEKAGSIGIDVAERSGYVYNNIGLNSFFNLFADFGFLGLFLGSVLFGLAAKKLNPTRANKTFQNRRFMYGILFSAMTPMFFRGDLSTAMLAFYPAILAYEVTRFAGRLQFGPSVG